MQSYSVCFDRRAERGLFDQKSGALCQMIHAAINKVSKECAGGPPII